SSRRQWLQAASASLAGCSMSGFLPLLANTTPTDNQPRRHCILLWMSGGPSQLDTFDMKPGHANGGTFKSINTSTPPIRISEHLPRLSKLTEHMAIVRSVSSKEGDHGRGTFVMRTGRAPDRVVRFPTLGSVISKELDPGESALPGFVAVNPFPIFNPQAYE